MTLAKAVPMRRLISVSRSAISLIAPPRYTKSVACLYRWPVASVRRAFDAVLGSDHNCMASVLTLVNPNSLHVTAKTSHHPGKPTRRCRHHLRIMCIQHPPHRSPNHFQRPRYRLSSVEAGSRTAPREESQLPRRSRQADLPRF